jgi:hypothetical protein
MEDASLDWFQPIIYVRDSAFENDVARVIEEPIGIHALEGLLGRDWFGVFWVWHFASPFLYRRQDLDV